MKKAYFAGGCFWCIGFLFNELKGVIQVIDGYSGGDEENPTYEEVKNQQTKHRETICIIYDENIISYDKLLNVFLDSVDPFDSEGQFIDKGFSYTLAVFYQNMMEKDVTNEKIKNLEKREMKKAFIAVLPFKNFYAAEDYHQNYAKKNPELFQKELKESGRIAFFEKRKENFTIKQVAINEMDQVIKILDDAKRLLGKNSLQWQQGYPNTNTMLKDIENEDLYGVYHYDKLVAFVALVKGIDENYTKIYDGKWIKEVSDNDLVIHRIAVKDEYRGLKIARRLMEYSIKYAAQKNCESIKADTHEQNKPMQHLLLNSGFTYQGIIYLNRNEIDNKRLAYELVIK